MINLIRTLSLPSDLLAILNDLKKQRLYLHHEVKPLTNSVMKENDGSLNDKDIHKIFNYYGLAVPAILGESFCILNGKTMSPTERLCSTSMGAMTGLFDDFFDKQFMADEEIRSSLTVNDTRSKDASNKKLFSRFYEQAIAASPSPELTKLRLMDVYEAQVKSRKQSSGNLNRQELIDLTLEKGATSLLFYYSCFQPNPEAVETTCIATLGGWMQLANDIFDVFKDRESSVHTLVTDCRNISDLRQLFLSQVRTAFHATQQLPLNRKGINGFINRISIGIFSRCLVCLDQLENNQRFTGNRFEVDNYSRKQLICDMDIPKNKIKSLIKHLTI